MIPTTFIFGAGVSMPFGYPSGESLKNEIIAAAENYTKPEIEDHLLDECMQTCLYPEDRTKQYVTQFARNLRRSTLRSIDYFIELNSNYDRIAKVLLSLVMLRHEVSKINCSLLPIVKSNGRSYGNAIHHIMSKIEDHEISDQELKNHRFITFNYDLCLEHYLYSYYKYGTAADRKDPVQEIINLLNDYYIYHVYGPLEHYNGAAYDEIIENKSTELSIADVESSMNNIQFIGRHKSETQSANVLSAMFKATKRVVILGFGFDKQNTQKIIRAFAQSRGHSISTPDINRGQYPRDVVKEINTNWYCSAYQKYRQDRLDIQSVLPINERNMGDIEDDDVVFMRKVVPMRQIYEF